MISIKKVVWLGVGILCGIGAVFAYQFLDEHNKLPIIPQPIEQNLLSWPDYRLRGVTMSANARHTEEDIKQLEEWGVNHIRLQLFDDGMDPLLGTNERPFDKEYMVTIVDPIIRWAGIHTIFVVIEPHDVPFADSGLSSEPLWNNEKTRTQYMRLWEELAQYYKDNKTVIGYDIVNEPNPADITLWNAYSKELTAAIRKHDTYHTIIVSAGAGADPFYGFKKFEPTGDSNTIYSIHMYKPHYFTHQGLDNPEWQQHYTYKTYNPNGPDRRVLLHELEGIDRFQKKYGLKTVYVGEFGSIAWEPSSVGYLKDVIQLFENRGWDWAYHSYREWEGWSLEHVGDRSTMKFQEVGETDRLRVLQSYWQRS